MWLNALNFAPLRYFIKKHSQNSGDSKKKLIFILMYFKISDFLIELEGINELFHPFNLFRVNGGLETSDIKLSLERRIPHQFAKEKLIFRAKRFWEIHQWQNKIIFWDKFNRNKHKYQTRFAIFDKKISRGKLYLSNNASYSNLSNPRASSCPPWRAFGEMGNPRNSALVKNPLSYPIGALLILNKLSQGNGLFVHATAVKDKDGKGYVFCGCSGTGKTTMAKIWQKNNQGTILNDDRIIIRKMGHKFYAYGCPWYATNNKLVSNERVEIKRVFFLKHSKKNYVKNLFPEEAFSKLLTHAFFPVWDKSAIDFSFGFLQDLSQRVPCFELGFRPEKEIVDFVRKI